jgi:L-ascorbate metabolism protein UlaG (beta-lactamase superfamily)
VLLLDAFFDRGSAYPPLGFAASDVSRVDAILLGHGHSDHMADAASIAIRTGAVVVGAPITIQALGEQGVAAEQMRSVRGLGDEVVRIGAFTVEPILARHGEPPSEVTSAFRDALQSVTDPLTPAQIEEQEQYRARGASGPRIVDEGTIAYLITLDNGFRLLYRDSGGRVTEFERAAGDRLGGVDVLLAPTAAAYLNTLTAAQAVEYVRTYRPDVFIPGHHDAPYNNLWRATEPIFQAVKEEDPDIVTISRSYREPICLDTDVLGG